MLLIAMASAHAWACPRGSVCVASQTRASVDVVRGEREIPASVSTLRGGFVLAQRLADVRPLRAIHELAATRGPVRLAIRRARLPEAALARSLRVHSVPRSYDVEMPWIWVVLRQQVYSRMPTYQERQFSMTFEPVVVSSPSDTVPGVGVGGVF